MKSFHRIDSMTIVNNFMTKFKIGIFFVLLCAMSATAQLAVTVSPPKITAQKAMVELKMKNGLAEKVESARAICFLLDDQGKMVGESARWVIGGTKKRPALEPKEEASFNFVITSPQPFATTNLTAKVSFNRLILEGGASVNPKDNVAIAQESPSINQVSVTNSPAVSKPMDDVIASASGRIPIKPAPQASSSEAVMVTNSFR
jgi:hypothetical protein